MATKFIDIFVGPSDEKGNVPLVYVHKDGIDLSAFGICEKPKVSHVRWDVDKQEWYAFLLDGTEIARDRDRAVVVEKEGQIISDMFARGEFIPGGFFPGAEGPVPVPDHQS